MRHEPAPSVRKMVRLSDEYKGPVDKNGVPPESVIQEISQKTGEHPKTVRITFEVREERKLSRKGELRYLRWLDEEKEIIRDHVRDQGGTGKWSCCAIKVNALPANIERGAFRNRNDVADVWTRIKNKMAQA